MFFIFPIFKRNSYSKCLVSLHLLNNLCKIHGFRTLLWNSMGSAEPMEPMLTQPLINRYVFKKYFQSPWFLWTILIKDLKLNAVHRVFLIIKKRVTDVKSYYKLTFADIGEGGVKKWGKIADVLNGRPLIRYVSKVNTLHLQNEGYLIRAKQHQCFWSH